MDRKLCIFCSLHCSAATPPKNALNYFTVSYQAEKGLDVVSYREELLPKQDSSQLFAY